MTKNTSHTNCTHPATKSARAKCRAAKKADALDTAQQIAAVVASYYDNTGEVEEIMGALHRLAPEMVDDYYHGDAEVEEIMGRF